MKRFFKVSLMLFISVFLLTGCGNDTTKDLGIDFSVDGNTTDKINYEGEYPLVAMKIKGYGAIVMELYPEYAPNTVDNFMYLVSTGFYDNNTFHRLMKGFVLQGGDPSGSGSGGPGYSIKGEFINNKFLKNTLKHTKGIISMARATGYDTAGSQFFIMLGEAPHLDQNYAAFGRVIDGFDLIERIENVEKVADTESGKLAKNLTIEKALVNPKGVEIKEPNRISE